MKRRELLKLSTSLSLLGSSAAVLSACSGSDDDDPVPRSTLPSVDGQAIQSFDMNVVNFTVPRDTSERWLLTSRHGDPSPHPFHVHGTQFRVLRINGEL